MDAKHAKKGINKCTKNAELKGIKQRQTYKIVTKLHLRDAYLGHHSKMKKKATTACITKITGDIHNALLAGTGFNLQL